MCFKHIFGNKMKSIYCSWLCFSTCAKMLGLYTYSIHWLCDLHMQYGGHICSEYMPS